MTLGADASRIRTRPGVMARIHSVTRNVLRANSVQNVSLDHLLAPSPYCQN